MVHLFEVCNVSRKNNTIKLHTDITALEKAVFFKGGKVSFWYVNTRISIILINV